MSYCSIGSGDAVLMTRSGKLANTGAVSLSAKASMVMTGFFAGGSGKVSPGARNGRMPSR